MVVLEDVPGYSAELTVGDRDCSPVRETFYLTEREVVRHVTLRAVATISVGVTSLATDGHSKTPVAEAYVEVEYARPEPSRLALTDATGSVASVDSQNRPLIDTSKPAISRS
jgi:hypothetical protein